MRSKSAVLIALLSLFSPVLRCQPRYPTVSTCEQETLAKTGIGISYRGTVRNDDYRFSATIPEREDLRLEPITVGGRLAARKSSVGSIGGTIYENVTVFLQVPHKNDDIHDVQIVLVTPKSDAARTRAIFDRFIASFRFL